MATRSRTTFKKRQKELARMEKQRDKAARREQRKLAAAEAIRTGIPIPDNSYEMDDAADSDEPEGPEGSKGPEGSTGAPPSVPE